MPIKKLLPLALALMLALSLASCSSNNDNSKENISTNPPVSQSGDDITPSKNNDGDNAPDSHDPKGKENLIPMNQTATVTAANRYDEKKHTATISVDTIYRGDEALAFINAKMEEAKSIFEAVPPSDADEEYLVAQFTYTLTSVVEGTTIEPFTIYVYTGALEQYPTLVASNFYNDDTFPQLDNMEVTMGQTVTGYRIFVVRKDDAQPVISYGSLLADGSDGVWFKLY